MVDQLDLPEILSERDQAVENTIEFWWHRHMRDSYSTGDFPLFPANFSGTGGISRISGLHYVVLFLMLILK